MLFLGAAGTLAGLVPGFAQCASSPRSGIFIPAGPLSGIGPLVDTGVDGIRAPRGFGLRAVARHLFDPVSGHFDPFGIGGHPWHKAPDGGACFAAPEGGWVYVSNCESNSVGGASALRFDVDGRVEAAYRVLDGTRRNCSGGATPWQTWLSCEEIGDGLVYECDPFGGPAGARSWPALGCFNHEAVAVDLHTRSLFLTEDAGDGRLYRFESAARTSTDSGDRLDLENGRLQVLNVSGEQDGGYAKSSAQARTLRPARWVDVPEPLAPQAQVRAARSRDGLDVPGTVFRGAEGIWVHTLPPALRTVPPGGDRPSRAIVFFACKGDNRVYALDIDNGLIEAVFDNTLEALAVHDVDGLVVGPAGDIVVSEDGAATRLIVLRPGQDAVTLLAAGHARSELTGLAFSPDGSRLYFSSQRGPNLPFRARGTGVTYELRIPADIRAAAQT